MRFVHPIPCVLVFALVFAFGFARPAVAEDQAICHFFVIHTPSSTQGGEGAVAAFKVELARLAGGYTSLGQAGGGVLRPDGQLDIDTHEALIVSAPKDLTKEIRHLAKTILKRDHMYLITWPVSGGYLPNE